jgi:hypothetical protein
MNRFDVERLCAWAGVAAIVLFFGGFICADFIPPPSPSFTVPQVASFYQAHSFGIRIGMLMMLTSGMFMAPFTAVISAQLGRIADISPALVYGQLVIGAANCLFFFIPAVLFLVTAYRPDRPPELTYMLNDLSWIMAVLPWPPACMQSLIIGLAVINDRAAAPVFPRWVAYLNFWIAIGFTSASVLVFFKAGPFAWSGLVPFWFAGTIFVVWFVMMVVTVLRAIGRQKLAQA